MQYNEFKNIGIFTVFEPYLPILKKSGAQCFRESRNCIKSSYFFSKNFVKVKNASNIVKISNASLSRINSSFSSGKKFVKIKNAKSFFFLYNFFLHFSTLQISLCWLMKRFQFSFTSKKYTFEFIRTLTYVCS